MTYHTYVPKNFNPANERLIHTMNGIIRDYQREGYVLTVRQLYYQMVARDEIENTIQSYKRLAGIISDARNAGMMSWDAIEDRTREFVERQRWTSPRQIVQASYDSYHMDMWVNQPNRVFVIVEKEALVGVMDRACRRLDVPLLAARGYPSDSVLREFAVDRVIETISNNQNAIILHLGDHDPSGVDMTRDIEAKLDRYTEINQMDYDGHIEVRRIALTMEQIEELRPPPNPAKSTDSRFAGYAKKFGNKSWELDALPPSYIDDLVSREIAVDIDDDAWEKREKVVTQMRSTINKMIFQVPGEDAVDEAMEAGDDDE